MSIVAVLNTDTSLAGKTLLTAEVDATITGLETFDRDPSAPFAVSASSSKVANLDADKVDGFDLDQSVATTGTPSFMAFGGASGALTLTCDGATIDENRSIGELSVVRCIGSGGIGTGAGTAIIGGFTAALKDGRILIVINQTGQSLVFNEESASSTAANRIAGITGPAPFWPDKAMAILIYSTATARWHLLNFF